MKISESKYSSLTKEVVLSVISLAVLYLFMGFSSATENLNNQNGKIFTSNHETINDEYNCDYFNSDNVSLPVHTLNIPIQFNHRFTLNNIDENLDNNKTGFETVTEGNFVQTEIDNFTRNIFNKQLIIDTKYPTEKALRSDILII